MSFDIEEGRSFFELLVDVAPKLRRAGVTSLRFRDVQMELAPAEYEGPVETLASLTEEIPTDPLKDPDTYIDGRVPQGNR